jgi:hypothetical protein
LFAVSPFWLKWMHGFSRACIGCLDALIFLCNPQVKRELHIFFRNSRMFGKHTEKLLGMSTASQQQNSFDQQIGCSGELESEKKYAAPLVSNFDSVQSENEEQPTLPESIYDRAARSRSSENAENVSATGTCRNSMSNVEEKRRQSAAIVLQKFYRGVLAARNAKGVPAPVSGSRGTTSDSAGMSRFKMPQEVIIIRSKT